MANIILRLSWANEDGIFQRRMYHIVPFECQRTSGWNVWALSKFATFFGEITDTVVIGCFILIQYGFVSKSKNFSNFFFEYWLSGIISASGRLHNSKEDFVWRDSMIVWWCYERDSCLVFWSDCRYSRVMCWEKMLHYIRILEDI